MSLILDALRKAEAERQRGHVPGLHGLLPAPVAAAPKTAARRWLWPSGALFLLAAGAIAWVLMDRSSEQPVAQASAPLPVPAIMPAPSPPLPTAPPAAEPLPLVVSAPPADALPTPPSPRPETARPPSRDAPIITQVRRLADLPPDQRRELPPLVVSGSVWSEQAASRFVMLDGQLLREGDSLVPGLLLIRIAPRVATLRWRDSLIEVPL